MVKRLLTLYSLPFTFSFKCLGTKVVEDLHFDALKIQDILVIALCKLKIENYTCTPIFLCIWAKYKDIDKYEILFYKSYERDNKG